MPFSDGDLTMKDIQYGLEQGFNQAIELSADVLSNVKFVEEKQLLQKFFDEVFRDTGRYCFGVQETLAALEMGAIETLIVWDSLDIARNVVRTSQAPEDTKVIYLRKDQQGKEASMAQGSEVVESGPLLEWIADNYQRFGADLQFVTNRSPEGSQYTKGFGGIGGILRYKLDMTDPDDWADEDATDGLNDLDLDDDLSSYV